MAAKKVTFKVKLVGEGPTGHWYAIRLPPKIHAALGGTKARIPVIGTADKHPIRTSAAPMGGCHMFPFNKEMQAGTGKGAGDTVTFVLARDDEERTVEAPADLKKALAKNPAAKKNFAAFAFTHKKEYVRWIEEAKKPETRARRIAKAVEMIAGNEPYS